MRTRIYGMVAFLFMTITHSFSQSVDNCKYFSAINFVSKDEQLNKHLQVLFFPKQKKKTRIDISISSNVRFMNITGMESDIIEKKFLEPDEVKTKIFREKYSFEPFVSGFLDSLKWVGKDNVFLSFSLPVNNCLLIEFTGSNPANTYISGPTLKAFLKFDEQNIVMEVIYFASIVH